MAETATELSHRARTLFQVQSMKGKDVISWEESPPSSASLDASHSENLATALYAMAHMQQIGDPIIFLMAEFLCS